MKTKPKRRRRKPRRKNIIEERNIPNGKVYVLCTGDAVVEQDGHIRMVKAEAIQAGSI